MLFIPLGVMIGCLSASRAKAGLVIGSYALPVLVEWTQLVAIQLGRQCQSADAIDNLVGLTLGIGAGTALALGRPPIGAGGSERRPGVTSIWRLVDVARCRRPEDSS